MLSYILGRSIILSQHCIYQSKLMIEGRADSKQIVTYSPLSSHARSKPTLSYPDPEEFSHNSNFAVQTPSGGWRYFIYDLKFASLNSALH
jgi:hypothetical protein